MFSVPTKLALTVPSLYHKLLRLHLSYTWASFLIWFIAWCLHPGLSHPQQLWLRFVLGVPHNAMDNTPSETVSIQSYPCPTLTLCTHGEKLQPDCTGCLYIPFRLTGQLLHRCLSRGPYCSFPLQKGTRGIPLGLTGF